MNIMIKEIINTNVFHDDPIFAKAPSGNTEGVSLSIISPSLELLTTGCRNLMPYCWKHTKGNVGKVWSVYAG